MSFARWLLHDERGELFEIAFAIAFSGAFVALGALLLWPMDQSELAWRWAAGFGALWVAAPATFLVLTAVQKALRIDLYRRSGLYVASNLALSSLLQLGWAAYAALAVQASADGSSLAAGLVRYALGLLSCHVAFVVVSAFYQGHLYRMVSLPMALGAFVAFSIWPAVARAILGWAVDALR